MKMSRIFQAHEEQISNMFFQSHFLSSGQHMKKSGLVYCNLNILEDILITALIVLNIFFSISVYQALSLILFKCKVVV